MFADVYHSVASTFASRLRPLTFGNGRNAQGGKQSSTAMQGRQFQTNTRSASPGKSTKASGGAPLAAAHAEVKRVGEDFHSQNNAARTRDSHAASDLLHTFNSRMGEIQAQRTPSGGAWDDFHAAFGHRTTTPTGPGPQVSGSPPSTSGRSLRTHAPSAAPVSTERPPEPSSSGVGKGVQRGLFSPKQAGPRVKASPVAPEPKAVDRHTQSGPGLFPRSAVSPSPVKNSGQFPTTGSQKPKRSGGKTTPKPSGGSSAPRVSNAELDAMVDSWTKK